MAKRDEIGAHVKLAFDNLRSVKALGFSDRNSCMILFYAAENLLMASFKAENIHNSQWRGSAQHQLDRMVDLLPDECFVKDQLRSLDPLTAYATTYRYPTVSGKAVKPMNSEDTRKMATTLASLVSKYCKYYGIDLKKQSPRSLHAKPMRADDVDQTPKPSGPGI